MLVNERERLLSGACCFDDDAMGSGVKRVGVCVLVCVALFQAPDRKLHAQQTQLCFVKIMRNVLNPVKLEYQRDIYNQTR